MARSGQSAGFGDLGETYKRFARHKGVNRRSTANRQIVVAWENVADAETREHTRIAGFRGGVLSIEVDSPARLSELTGFHSGALLKKIQNEAPAGLVTGLRFSLAKDRSRPGGIRE